MAQGRNPPSLPTGYKILLVILIACLISSTAVIFVLCLTGHDRSSQADSMGASPPPTYPFVPHSANDEIRIKEMIEEINRKKVGWIAEYNPFAAIVPLEGGHAPADYSSLNGTKSPHEASRFAYDDCKEDTRQHISELKKHTTALPTSFDARDEWPRCWTINNIMNQGGCGSCWAAATTSMISDRLCISSNSSIQSQISLEDLTSCCAYCGGCTGIVSTGLALYYWKTKGIVTGGSFASNEGCRPYSIQSTCGTPCPPDIAQKKFTPKCIKKCQPLYNKKYEEDLVKARVVYRFEPYDIESIKREIMLHGPLIYCVSIKEPFMHYKTGVYSNPAVSSSHVLQYAHCLKIIGWGKEEGTEYWTIANSWGRQWGENGFGRISIDHGRYDLYTEIYGGLF